MDKNMLKSNNILEKKQESFLKKEQEEDPDLFEVSKSKQSSVQISPLLKNHKTKLQQTA